MLWRCCSDLIGKWKKQFQENLLEVSKQFETGGSPYIGTMTVNIQSAPQWKCSDQRKFNVRMSNTSK